jgi:hypothetical protein
MQAYLKFDLPDDEYELRASLDGMDHIAKIRDFQEKLRALKKYGHGFENTEQAIESLYNDYCCAMAEFL